MSALLSSRRLGVRIGGIIICADLDLDIEPGQSWGILGCNGAGKTTLLHTLAGLHPHHSGRIYLRGIPQDQLPRKNIARQLGLLLQEQTDPFPATVLELALCGRHPFLKPWQWESAADIERARRSLRQVELGGLEQRLVGTLSGGERRRLAFATLLTQDPELLLLDEPVNHLDLRHQVRLLNLLNSQRLERNKAMIMVLHDINLAARYCSHLLLLLGNGQTRHGECAAMLDPELLEKVYRHPLLKIESPEGSFYFPETGPQ